MALKGSLKERTHSSCLALSLGIDDYFFSLASADASAEAEVKPQVVALNCEHRT